MLTPVTGYMLTRACFSPFVFLHNAALYKCTTTDGLAMSRRFLQTACAFSFYRAMLCIRGTSHGPVSVSVTSRSSTKAAKRRITQTTPHDTPRTLVFWCQRSPRNSTGVTPYGGAKCRWGGSKSATFANNRLYLENSKR